MERSLREANAVVKEVRIEAAPDTVFDFFMDREKMLRWKGLEAEINPTPGGIYRVRMEGDNVARGEYVEVDRPRRVVISWGWEGEGSIVPPGSSRVEIDLTPDGSGTLLRLTHLDLPEEAREMHGMGWQMYLARLVDVAEGREPPPVQVPDGAKH